MKSCALLLTIISLSYIQSFVIAVKEVHPLESQNTESGLFRCGYVDGDQRFDLGCDIFSAESDINLSISPENSNRKLHPKLDAIFKNFQSEKVIQDVLSHINKSVEITPDHITNKSHELINPMSDFLNTLPLKKKLVSENKLTELQEETTTKPEDGENDEKVTPTVLIPDEKDPSNQKGPDDKYNPNDSKKSILNNTSIYVILTFGSIFLLSTIVTSVILYMQCKKNGELKKLTNIKTSAHQQTVNSTTSVAASLPSEKTVVSCPTSSATATLNSIDAMKNTSVETRNAKLAELSGLSTSIHNHTPDLTERKTCNNFQYDPRKGTTINFINNQTFVSDGESQE